MDTILQWGKIKTNAKTLTIKSMGITAESRYQFVNTLWKPAVALSGSFISGDKNPDDDELNTFDPLYPKPIYGLAVPQGPSNVKHIRYQTSFYPTQALSLTLSVYRLWRASRHDGTYTPSMTQVRFFPKLGSDSKSLDIGSQIAFDVFYRVNENLTLLNIIAHVTPGRYIKDTGAGKTNLFFTSSLQYKF